VFTSDKVFGIFRDLPPVRVVELGIFSQGVAEGPQLGEVPERLPAARHQHVSNDSQTEEISGRGGKVANLTVLAMCNFRSHEPNSATKSTMCIAIGQSSSETKVDQLESKLFTGVDEHHILRLEVEVDDVRVVDKDQRLHNLHHEPLTLLLSQVVH